ncbi:hypothetical protein FOZ61_001664, partial [Perkinsus olseni]
LPTGFMPNFVRLLTDVAGEAKHVLTDTTTLDKVTQGSADRGYHRSAKLGDVLAWRYHMSRMRKRDGGDGKPSTSPTVNKSVASQLPPTPQLSPSEAASVSLPSIRSTGMSQQRSTLSWKTEASDADTLTVSKMSNLIKDIPLPGGKPYQGYGESRSISWFVQQLNDEAQLHGLQPKASWLYVTKAFAPSARGTLIANVRQLCTATEWMKDYRIMLDYAIAYLCETYSSSDDASYHESRLNDMKQKDDENIFTFLERVTNEAAQAQSCHLNVTEEQTGRYFRRGLLSVYAKIANEYYASTLHAPELACELARYCRLNRVRPPPGKGGSRPTGKADQPAEAARVPPSFSTEEFNYLHSGTEDLLPHVSLEEIKKAVKSEASTTTTPTVTSPAKPAEPTAHKVIHGSSDEKRTLRSPDLRGVFIEIDTGCSMSIISAHAFDVLSQAKLINDVIKVDQSFTTASGSKSLHASRRVYVTITIIDSDGESHKMDWQPYVVDTAIPQCDGLLGKDLIIFGERGLEISLPEGTMDLALFWCTRPEMDTLQPVSSIPFQRLPTITGPTADDDDDCLDSNDDANDDALKVTSNVTVPDFKSSTFAPVSDPIEHVIYDGVWYRVSVHRKNDGTFYFLSDFSTEFGDWLDGLQMQPVPKIHWKWAKADEVCRRECTAQLEKFVTNKKLIAVPNAKSNLFRSNFYGTRGRKRYRVVTPLVKLNGLLRLAMAKYKLPNPQSRITSVIHRLRCAEAAHLLDVRDAFMCIHCGATMS